MKENTMLDLMLAGTQQSVELKLALDQEQQKSKKLEESMRKLDEEMRRTDELLYQMIPKQVADRLRKGENPIDTCEMFDSVSILFSDVVTFTEICSRITPMEVVSMLNGMYSIFDTLTERNRVYKVETIGDAYMVVSGAPEKEGNHAERVCDMALDMVDAIQDLKDPSTGQHLKIRVGVHSGAVVAGIVGLKMPRYCLFGDSVNTASRMESTSETMMIHISEYTRKLLPNSYKVLERGEIQVKGKGHMKTYWLQGKEARLPIDRRETAPLVQQEIDPFDNREFKTNMNAEDRRSVVYSPITFQDVARRSIASSPVKHSQSTRGLPTCCTEKSVAITKLRSNSAGAVYGMHNPADIFGSMIVDNSPIREHRDKPTCHLQRRPTVSSAQDRRSFIEEISLIAQGSPLASPPPAILLSNHVEKETKLESKEDSIEHDEKDNNEVNKYEFGKSMFDYAKRFETRKHERCTNHKEIPVSKSDGDLQGKKALVNNLSSNHLNKSQHHHHHHQHQCCSGFGSGSRHRFQSNACTIS